jgi:hypothetical protein
MKGVMEFIHPVKKGFTGGRERWWFYSPGEKGIHRVKGQWVKGRWVKGRGIY